MSLPDSSPRDERCLLTYSGKPLLLHAPDPTQIEIADLAHGLAYQCCFNGQTRYFYSIAQHSMLVAQLVAPQYRLAALLHHGAAAYIGAMPKSLWQLMLEYQFIEKKIMAVLGEKFGIADFATPAIKRAHQIARATEQRDLLCQTSEAAAAPELLAPIPRRIEALPPEEVKYQFTELLGELVHKAAQKSTACGAGESQRPRPANPRSTPLKMIIGRSGQPRAAADKTGDQNRPPSATI